MKKKAKEIREKLMRQLKPAWDRYTNNEKKKVFQFGDGFKDFLTKVKTERETVSWIIEHAKKKGFVDKSRKNAKKIFIVNHHKSAALIIIGKRSLQEGIRIVVSHIDSPRLDLKPNPLYEEAELAMLRTHYYGGIKKYQWTALPLSLHGVILKENGKKITIAIGDDPKDPVFTVVDLLPHLSRKEQSQKKISEAIEGEKLTLLTGSIPFPDNDEKERVKINILDILNTEYGIKEDDFISAEIEVVPALPARDVGWDRSFIGGYGQDDRICAYASFIAIKQIENPMHSTIVLFVDKEEIGSVGATGARSQFLVDCIREIILRKRKSSNFDMVRNVLCSSKALSGDVNTAINPNYQNVLEKANAAKLGFGVVLTKYTGAGGKYGTNDASAEFVSEIRNLFNTNKVIWQTGELGKVDEGGGGTVSEFISQPGIETIDCGTAILGMH
ncbi:MAG: aminopeptidase, partial [Candidatus Cloacimonadota bacterium]